MPTVPYMTPMQGFRPKTNPRGSLGLYGLRGLGDSNTFSGCTSALDSNGNPVACNDPSAAIWMDANGNAVPPGTPTGVSAAAANTNIPSSGIPTGSVLNYGATINASWFSSESAIISAIVGSLAANGINVTQQATGSASGLGNFVLTLQLQIAGAGFAQVQDVKSIVDHAIYVQTGHMPLNSAAELVSTPTMVTGAVPLSTQIGAGASSGGAATTCDPLFGCPSSSQPTTATSWLAQNALWIGLGLLAVVVLKR